MKAPIAPAPSRARRWLLRSLLVMLVALCGCAYALISGGSVNLAKAEQIETGIQNLRGLNFKSSVPVVVMTPDEAQQVILAEIDRDYTDEQMKTEGLVGTMVGLYPVGIDLKAETLKLLKSQIAGFYEARRKEMILVSGTVDIGFWNQLSEFMIQRDLMNEMLLAHELTHALQDQNFGVDAALENLKDNDDRQLALKSVAEGDATLAGLGYATGKMDDNTVDVLVARLDELPAQFAAQNSGAPEALSTPLIFQYSAGARFVGEAFHRGGWKAVDDLYRNPPQSSQQIMHPALYFTRPVLPAEITLRGYQTVLPDWQKVDENTLGELLLKVILTRTMSASAPEVGLAQAWSGDRMVVLRHGHDLTVVWLVLFRDIPSADRFTVSYGTSLDQILGAATPHHVEVRSGAVLTIVGAAANRYRELAPAIWDATRITQPSRPAPLPVRAELRPAPATSPG